MMQWIEALKVVISEYLVWWWSVICSLLNIQNYPQHIGLHWGYLFFFFSYSTKVNLSIYERFKQNSSKYTFAPFKIPFHFLFSYLFTSSIWEGYTINYLTVIWFILEIPQCSLELTREWDRMCKEYKPWRNVI